MPVRTLDSIVPSDYAKVIVAHSVDVETRRLELYATGVQACQVVIPLQNPVAETEEALSGPRDSETDVE